MANLVDLSSLDATAGAFLASAGGTVLRATALLAGVLVLSRLARRSEAGIRHALWSLTFVALLVLPVLPRALPGIPLLPSLGGGRAPQEVVAAVGTASAGRSQELASTGASTSSGGAAEGSGPTMMRPPAVAASAPPPERSLAFRAALALLWLAGALLGAGSLAIGLWRSARAVRAGASSDDPVWRQLHAEVARALGIRRPVRLLLSEAVSTPLAGGFLRPVVLLPASARSWGAERLQIVLRHELVHISRADAVRQVLSRVVVSLYWFHPLVWWAAREGALAREQACDDAVLCLGERPSTYARHLLELAVPAPLPLPAISRLGHSHLEKRLMAVLQPRARVARSRRAAVAVVVGVTLWTLSVAAVAPRASSAGVQALAQGSITSGIAVVRPRPVLGSLLVGGAVAEPRTARATAAGAMRQTAPASSCWIDGFHGSFNGSYSQTTAKDGGRVIERYGFADGDRVIETSVGDLRICLHAHDPVELSEDLTRVVSVGDGGWVLMAAQGANGTQELELSPGSDGGQPRWTVNGQERAFDAAAREWRDAMLAVLGARWQISRIRGRVSSLLGEISSIRGHESSLRGEISSIRGHVSSLRGEISSIRGEESSKRGEISSIRGRESSLRGEISSIRGQESSLRGEISSLRGRIAGLESARRSTRDDDTRSRLVSEIEDLEAAIADVERRIVEYDADGKVAGVERQIAEYDAAARVQAVEQRLRNDDVDRQVQGIEQQIADYDADARIADVEKRIAALDVSGEVARIEGLIEVEDADRRVAAIEAKLEPAERRLEESVRAIR